MNRLLVFFVIASFNQLDLSHAELCIFSVNYNTITYKLDCNLSTSLEKQIFTLKELRIINSKALGLSLDIAINNNSMDSETFKYFATKNNFLSIMKPEAFDSVTFGVLSFTDRISSFSLTLLTSTICSSEDDSNDREEDNVLLVLQSIFAPFEFDSIKPLSPPQSILSVVKSSGILLFLSNSILSLLIVFEVLPLCLKYFVRTKDTTIKSNTSIQTNNQCSVPRPLQHAAAVHRPTTATAQEHAIVMGVYLVSVCCTVAYIGYWIFDISGFILRDTSKYNSFLALERKSTSPFLVNLIFLSIMLITSIIIALLIAIKHDRPSKLKCRSIFKIFVFVGSSCMTMLITCVIYHGFFLMIALVIDYKMTLNEIIYFATLLIAIYCSVPTILKLFYSSKKSKEYMNFIFSSSLLFIVPVLYCLLMSCIGSDSQIGTIDLSELTITTLSSIMTLAIVFTIVILVFGKKNKNNLITTSNKVVIAAKKSQDSEKQKDGNKQQQQTAETREEIVTKQRKPRKFDNRSIQHILFIMLSNPGRVITIVQSYKPSPVPQEISQV